MAASTNYQFMRLVKLFEETWAERDALRMMRDVDANGDNEKWEKVFEASQLRAQELFQPAISAMRDGHRIVSAVEALSERLSKESEPLSSGSMSRTAAAVAVPEKELKLIQENQ